MSCNVRRYPVDIAARRISQSEFAKVAPTDSYWLSPRFAIQGCNAPVSNRAPSTSSGHATSKILRKPIVRRHHGQSTFADNDRAEVSDNAMYRMIFSTMSASLHDTPSRALCNESELPNSIKPLPRRLFSPPLRPGVTCERTVGAHSKAALRSPLSSKKKR